MASRHILTGADDATVPPLPSKLDVRRVPNMCDRRQNTWSVTGASGIDRPSIFLLVQGSPLRTGNWGALLSTMSDIHGRVHRTPRERTKNEKRKVKQYLRLLTLR